MRQLSAYSSLAKARNAFAAYVLSNIDLIDVANHSQLVVRHHNQDEFTFRSVRIKADVDVLRGLEFDQLEYEDTFARDAWPIWLKSYADVYVGRRRDACLRTQ